MKCNVITSHKLLLNRIVLSLFVVIFSFVTSVAQIPELIYFKCNSSSGGNVTNDAQTATRVSVNGTLNGVTIGGTGQFGAALQGTGGTTPTNSLNANWPMSLSGPWTLSLWMKGFTNTLSSNYIFGGSGGSTFRAMTGTGLVSGGGNIMVRGTGMNDILINGVFNSTGSAVVVHIVYDPTTPATRVYVNGVLSLTVAQSATMTLTGTDFRVGGQASSNAIPAGSLVDEFRLYNRALTAGEIAATWNVDLNAGPPCTQPGAITISSFNSTTVDFSWPAVPASVGYEYAVDPNPAGPLGTPTPTTNTSAVVTGLNPATLYYIHVRNKCTGNGISQWRSQQFQTLPPCSKPAGFIPTYIDSDSASFVWTALVTGTDYQYIVNQDRSTPASASAAITTINNGGAAGGLTEGNVYYVHIRSRCPGKDSSAWSLDSFYTPIVCRDANVGFRDLTTNRVVAYWNQVLTAVSYEYALTQSQNPPPSGTMTTHNSVLLSFLDEGTPHYFHIRTNCSDRTVVSKTDWKTFEFKTIGVGVNNIEGTGSGISIYPNPAGNVLQLKINGKILQGASATITNVNGMTMQQLDITRDVTTIDVKNYAAGIYFVKFTDDNGTQVVRVLKQ